MTRSDLLARVRQRPFRPFRLVVSEGATYDVRRPYQLLVNRDSVAVGLPGVEPDQDFYETTRVVDLFHIVCLGPLEAPAGGQ